MTLKYIDTDADGNKLLICDKFFGDEIEITAIGSAKSLGKLATLLSSDGIAAKQTNILRLPNLVLTPQSVAVDAD